MSGRVRKASPWRSVKRDVLLQPSVATPWTNVVGVKEASYNACDLWVRGPESYKLVHFRIWAVNGPIEVLVYEGQIGEAPALRILPDGAITAIVASIRDRPCDGFRVEAQRGTVEHEVGHWRLEAGWKDGPQGDRPNRAQVNLFAPPERQLVYGERHTNAAPTIYAPPQFVAVPNRRLVLTNVTMVQGGGAPPADIDIRNMLGAFPQPETRMYAAWQYQSIPDHFTYPIRGAIGASWDISFLLAHSQVSVNLVGYIE